MIGFRSNVDQSKFGIVFFAALWLAVVAACLTVIIGVEGSHNTERVNHYCSGTRGVLETTIDPQRRHLRSHLLIFKKTIERYQYVINNEIGQLQRIFRATKFFGNFWKEINQLITLF